MVRQSVVIDEHSAESITVGNPSGAPYGASSYPYTQILDPGEND